ncbi:MAG: bifunctional precorrin-2 dehydrogenase/sirohydrochlorin ferrochelatase [Desulfomonilaceae bacterium]
MKPYPIMMSLAGKRVIVVGGGRVGRRKIMGLIESGASITVISPKLERELQDLAQQGQIEWLAEKFDKTLLDRYPEAVLVFGTTDQREVNIAIHGACADKRIPCNIADVPDLCTFIVPAVITQGDLMIAVSTGGASPALARRIREDLEKHYGPEYGEMTRVLGELRKLVLQTGSSSDANKKIFRDIVSSEVLAAFRDNDRERVLEILKAILPQNVDPEPAVEERSKN